MEDCCSSRYEGDDDDDFSYKVIFYAMKKIRPKTIEATVLISHKICDP